MVLLILFSNLGWQAWVTLLVLIVMIYGLIRGLARPDFVLLGSLGLLLVAGILPPEIAFSGFSNTAVLTIGALFIVAAGVQRTEALAFLDKYLFPEKASLPVVLMRFMLPTAFLSAFLNNTPIVATLIPRVQQYAAKTGIPASRLLIPLSYAAIVGGMITLIGTSTNLMVSGLLEVAGHKGFALFELTSVGLPVALVAILYMAFVGYRSLPAGGTNLSNDKNYTKSYHFDLRVSSRSSYIGVSVEEAGLRGLEAAFLTHIMRKEHLIAPVGPNEVLQAGDILSFAGSLDILDELLQRPGIKRVIKAIDESESLPIYEAVLAKGSILVGQTLKSINFRNRFQAVVLAIQRSDEAIRDSLGQVVLQAGDLLVIEARHGFDSRWNQSRDEFYLVAPKDRTEQPDTRRAPIAISIMLGMVVAAGSGLMPLVTASFAAALGMIVTGCLRGLHVRMAVNMTVLLTIAAALGIGRAIEYTGLAQTAADGISALASGSGPLVALILIYICTTIFTELITNSAAAALMVPVALSVATTFGLSPHAFAVAVAIAASASFLTPIGYQTNLMVMGAGGYRYKDYFKAGLPVSLIVMTLSVTLIYNIWL